nr:MAG TPA: hypothetical protein [Caudoviricetes sp.]
MILRWRSTERICPRQRCRVPSSNLNMMTSVKCGT